MAQCQTYPDGQCMMGPHCSPGECYLYAVAMKEHADAVGAVAEDPDLARALADEALAFLRGPYTENEPWEQTKLALVNALIDTLIPGARLVVEPAAASAAPARVYLGRARVWDRPRDLARTLRELADCLDGGR
jgi:hypothetical protein